MPHKFVLYDPRVKGVPSRGNHSLLLRHGARRRRVGGSRVAHRRRARSPGRKRLVKELPTRTIQFAGQDPLNFVTLELLDESGKELGPYAVFFEVTKDSKRRGRLLLHVQSAYHLDVLTQRQAKAGKVKFDTLLRAAFEGRKIKG